MRGWPLALVVTGVLGCKEPARSNNGGGSVRAKVEAEQRAPRLPPKGVRRIAGPVQDLRASADGRLLTVLVNGQKPTQEGVPPPMRVGELWAVPAVGGEPTQIASGVTNLPGGWLVSPDGRWIIAAARWDVARQRGVLEVSDSTQPSVEAHVISPRVSYAVMSDDGGQLAWVEEGVLSVGPLPLGPWRQVAGEVSTAEFSADGRYLYFKRRYAAAGGLFQVDLAAAHPEPRRLLEQVAEYTVLRSGKRVVATARATPSDRVFQLHVIDVATQAQWKVADDAIHFRTSRDGRFLAWRTSSVNGLESDIGELWVAELPHGAPRRLGTHVKDFEFSPDGKRLVFRENYVELPLGGREAQVGDAKLEKVGDLNLVELPQGAPRLLQRLCPNFLFSPDGQALAYTGRIERPEVTRRLFLMRGGGEPLALKDWLYEYQFRPNSAELFFRADCTREGRACDLLSVAKEGDKPKKEAGGVFGARFSLDGGKVVLAFAHLTDEWFDVIAKDLTTGKETAIDQFVEWPGLLLGEKGEHLAYLVHEKARPGLYVAPTE